MRYVLVLGVVLLLGCPQRPPETPVVAAEPIKLDGELSVVLRLIESHRTDRARTALAAYGEAHPPSGPAEFLTGLSYHREKRYGLARPHFERAIELTPGYHPTHHFLGWCCYYLGDTAASRQAFERHLQMAPSEGDSHFGLGLLDLDEDRLDAAEARFRRAIELQQDNPARDADVAKAHARLADVFIRRDQLDEARWHLEQATTLWPQHYAAFYKLSRVLTRLGENDQAQEAHRLYRLWQKRARPPRGVPEPEA